MVVHHQYVEGFKKVNEDDEPGTLGLKDYLTIVACVIGVVAFFVVFPEYIAPHMV